MAEQWVEHQLSPVVQWKVLEMSNGHAGANCAVVTGSNGIPVSVDKAAALHKPIFIT